MKYWIKYIVCCWWSWELHMCSTGQTKRPQQKNAANHLLIFLFIYLFIFFCGIFCRYGHWNCSETLVSIWRSDIIFRLSFFSQDPESLNEASLETLCLQGHCGWSKLLIWASWKENKMLVWVGLCGVLLSTRKQKSVFPQYGKLSLWFRPGAF